MITLGLIEIFLALEFFLVLLLIPVLLLVRSRTLSRRVKKLSGMEKRVSELEKEAVGYDALLRDEILKTKGFIDHFAEQGEAPNWMKARLQFLELELNVLDDVNDVAVYREKLQQGFATLIEQYRPAAQVITETLIEEIAVKEEVAKELVTDGSEDQEHEKEVARLRDLIGHQQDAMKKLRAELENHEGDTEDLASIMKQLDAFERQSAELFYCIEVLEKENERLKHATDEGDTSGSGPSPEELGKLRDMVNNQQSTIGNLQTMIERLQPEVGKAHELEDIVGDVLRSNQELNTCIFVLEDENQSLRSQLDALAEQGAPVSEPVPAEGDIAALQHKIQELESLLDFKDATQEQLEKDLEKLRAGKGDKDNVAGEQRVLELEALITTLEQKLAEAEGSGSSDEELEIKVQELEALLEFKEATIEELEKQVAALEKKHLELNGDEKSAGEP